MEVPSWLRVSEGMHQWVQGITIEDIPLVEIENICKKTDLVTVHQDTSTLMICKKGVGGSIPQGPIQGIPRDCDSNRLGLVLLKVPIIVWISSIDIASDGLSVQRNIYHNSYTLLGPYNLNPIPILKIALWGSEDGTLFIPYPNPVIKHKELDVHAFTHEVPDLLRQKAAGLTTQAQELTTYAQRLTEQAISLEST